MTGTDTVRRWVAWALACCVGAWAPGALPAAGLVRPQVALLLTCSALAPNTYPADTQNWFDTGRDSRVVFFAQLLFPVAPLPDEADPASFEAWHPPMAVAGEPVSGGGPNQAHYAEAEWLDPAGKRVALYGTTLSARSKNVWTADGGRAYIPQTFAMAIGTRDLRAAAGQVRLPDQKGLYTVRLRVDGRSVGLAFFSIVKIAAPTPAPAPRPSAASGYPAPRIQGREGAGLEPLVLPKLEPLKLP